MCSFTIDRYDTLLDQFRIHLRYSDIGSHRSWTKSAPSMTPQPFHLPVNPKQLAAFEASQPMAGEGMFLHPDTGTPLIAAFGRSHVVEHTLNPNKIVQLLHT